MPLTESFATGSFFTIGFGESGASAARRFTGGPAAIVHIAGRFGFEADALYQRLGFDRADKTGGVFYTFTSGTANSWEFPLLGRVRARRIGAAELYLSAGPSFRTVSGVWARYEQVNPIQNSSGHSSQDFTFDRRSNFGGAAAIGVRVGAGCVKLSPEVRYTRWRQDSPLDNLLYWNPNQAAFLLGITF